MPSDEFRRYALAGVTLQSEVPLPELRDASTPAAPDWTFRLGSRKPALPTERWFHHWRAADGRRWLSVGRQRDAYVLRFARTATFRLSPDARTILCDGAARVPARMMRHLFLNQVFPLALTRVDRLVLHASAVVAGAGTVGFAGQTGSGKSTLAAALSCVGAPLVSDDALVADRSDDGFVTAPMYDAVRLWPDSLAALCGTMADRGSPAFARGSDALRRGRPAFARGSDALRRGRPAFARGSDALRRGRPAHHTRKRLVNVVGSAVQPSRLRVLCLLGTREAMRRSRRVEMQPIPPRDALIRVTRIAFHLDVQDRHELGRSFDRLSALVDAVPVVELTYPWRLASASETAHELLEALASFR